MGRPVAPTSFVVHTRVTGSVHRTASGATRRWRRQRELPWSILTARPSNRAGESGFVLVQVAPVPPHQALVVAHPTPTISESTASILAAANPIEPSPIP